MGRGEKRPKGTWGQVRTPDRDSRNKDRGSLGYVGRRVDHNAVG